MRRRTSLVSVLAATALAVTGCGLTDDGAKPGVAAEVDGRSVELSRVDQTVHDYCSLLESEPTAPSYARAAVRAQIAWNWAQAVAVEELAEEYDLTLPGKPASAAIKRNWGVGPDDDSFESFEWLSWIGQRLGQPLEQIGTKALADGRSAGDAQSAAEVGEAVVDEWLEENDVVLNPVFGTHQDGKVFTGDDLSAAYSGVARAGEELALETDEESVVYERLAGLPASEVCGSPLEQAAPVG